MTDRTQIPERHRQVLDFVSEHPTATLEEIGSAFGVTRERARQILAKLEKRGIAITRKEDRKNAKRTRDNEAALKEEQDRQRARLAHQRIVARGRAMRRRFLRDVVRASTHGIAQYERSLIYCAFPGCRKLTQARGFCGAHYLSFRRNGILAIDRKTSAFCCEKGCEEPVYAVFRCQVHYQSYRVKVPAHPILPASNKSGYRGVSRASDDSGWIANIGIRGVQHYLGNFGENKIGAAMAYDAKAFDVRGWDAKLNFPDRIGEPIPLPISQVFIQHKNAKPKRPTQTQGHHAPIRPSAGGRFIVSLWVSGTEVYHGIFLDEPTARHAYQAQRKRFANATGEPRNDRNGD